MHLQKVVTVGPALAEDNVAAYIEIIWMASIVNLGKLALDFMKLCNQLQDTSRTDVIDYW